MNGERGLGDSFGKEMKHTCYFSRDSRDACSWMLSRGGVELPLNQVPNFKLTPHLCHRSAKPTRPHEFFALSDVLGETTRGGKSVEVTSRHLKV